MADSISLKVDGLQALYTKLLVTYPGIAKQAMSKALYQEAEKIMAASKKLVPVESGTLRSSGHVDLPNVNGWKITVDLGYGGAAAKYAWRQHEDLSFKHKVGQAKFLEQPAVEAQSGMLDRIKSSVGATIMSTTGGGL